MALRPHITLYVDLVSPFAYEAYYILRNENIFKQCDVRYVPIFLGGLMKTCAYKDKWIVKERLRWAKAFGIPMKDEMPSGFPMKTLTAMRALCVVASLDKNNEQERLTSVLDVLYHSQWAEHLSVQEPEVLEKLLRSTLGDLETKQDNISTDGKKILAENTAKSFADGAFGLPWFVCTNPAGQKEGFWGVDHLGQALQFLGLNKPHEGGWRALL